MFFFQCSSFKHVSVCSDHIVAVVMLMSVNKTQTFYRTVYLKSKIHSFVL